MAIIHGNLGPRSKGAGDVSVSLKPTPAQNTADMVLWIAIRNRIKAIGFDHYAKFIDNVFCSGASKADLDHFDTGLKMAMPGGKFNAHLSIAAIDSYNVLKLATEIFLLFECGIVRKKREEFVIPGVDEEEESSRFRDPVNFNLKELLAKYFAGTNGVLPYLDRILTALLGEDWESEQAHLPYCQGVLDFRFHCPCMLELIWSYWLEEGMQVQTMNAIALRFQNRRGPADRDPLAELEIDPLRPLNNLFWGYIQNEHNRLTVLRRAHEYDHHYGLTIYGKAIPKLRTADSRSKFLQGFHNLLNRAFKFYRDDADTTVFADAFPLMNALREVHLILAEGAHNQFGDLPWTARVEMLVEQWLLARPEMQDFLRGRAMVPYREPWMGRVEAMKRLQGWSDVSITHFHELATYGEQLILTIRYGDWIEVNDEEQAKNWARYWKPEVQGYIHAYRAVTGADLTVEPVDATPPWMHLKRQEEQKRASGR